MNTATSLYQQAMGPTFDLLAPELRVFHSMSGRIKLSGKCTVEGPGTKFGKLLGWMLSLPKTVGNTDMSFDLEASHAQETWTRYFPGRTMTSCFHVANGILIEQIGPVRLKFDLSAHDGTLTMRLQDITFLGIPCPKLMLPSVIAEEKALPDEVHFNIDVRLPIVGLIVAYRGFLNVRTAKIQP